MICIAYLSTAAASPGPAELEAILAVSRTNNLRRGVTGLLCHHDGSFLQFLEGDDETVDEVYARIGRDPRHHSMVKLYRRPIDARLFADWTMALVDPDVISDAHRRFCEGLRELQVGLSDVHAEAVAPFLTTFRAWLR